MGDLHSSLLGCLSDIPICCAGLYCPCFLTPCNQASVREEDCGCQHCICYPNEFWIRQHIRDREGIRPDCCFDCISLLICFPCFICQNAREIKKLNIENIGSKKLFKQKDKKKNKEQNVNSPPQQPQQQYNPQQYPPQQYPPQPQPFYPPPVFQQYPDVENSHPQYANNPY